MTSEELYDFLSDPKLVDLIEQVKVSDDILDVIDLSENQHSDMLAWCLTPNEGHGQGDAVIKDFLIAAYHAAQGKATFDNKKFFAKWTPGRIRTSSFGSAFLTREFSVKLDGGSHSGRLDLFLIDPTNEIIVAIENKAGARLTESQLSGYYDAVSKEIGYRPVFLKYSFAFVVLDKELDSYDDDALDVLGTKWALLDYGWLRAAANRAKHHFERNNQAVQLLLAYCQKQTAWEKPAERLLSELSAELAMKHESVTGKIRQLMKLKLPEWTPSALSGYDGELLLFFHQNRQLCRHLVQARGIGAVTVRLKKALPNLETGQLEVGRTWLALITHESQTLMRTSEEAGWPLYVSVVREARNALDFSKFSVRLIWRKDHFDETCKLDELRQHFAKKFPGLRRFEDSDGRRILINKNLDAESAVKAAINLIDDIDTLIREARNKNLTFRDGS
ncbi:PDDEXK-like family protein [Paraburkholderia tropica]|uniref:PDDEXK-like family protein n=1 Tax=Paraburkholderia tropica TaxID=92647 RepID=UPI002AB78579|nr:PD-(D/E)XK nuclease family protein [Paraburkholderia tropica]